MKVNTLKLNPKNPRVIKDEKFKQLVKSIKEFPEMMAKRPMVCVTDVDGRLFPLGGNMRLKAIQHIGFTDIPDTWVMLADDWTQEQRNRFTISDNVSYGEFDWDELFADWDTDLLSDWGLDVPIFDEINQQDYSDKNKEIDTDDFSDKMKMTFEFSSEEYSFVQTRLSYLSASKEESILKVLKYEHSEI